MRPAQDEEKLADHLLLSATRNGDQLRLVATGAWTASHAAQLERATQAHITGNKSIRAVTLDMAGVEQFDTYGAWLLRSLRSAYQERGKDTHVTGLADRYRGLQQDVDQIFLARPSAGAGAWS